MTEEKTLLQKAQAVPVNSRHTYEKFSEEERMQLSLAWLNDEITIGQVSKAFGTKGTSGYTHMAQGLKHAFREGLLKYPLGKFRLERGKFLKKKGK